MLNLVQSSIYVVLNLAFILDQVQAGETSLFIPGFDPQPLSATILGVGSDSRTTYEIFPAQPTATDQDASGLTGPFTYVAGPDDVFYSLPVPGQHGTTETVFQSCVFDESGNADCVVVEGGQTQTTVEMPVSIPVEFGGSGSAGGSSPSGSGPSTTVTESTTTGDTTPSPTGGSSSGATQGATTSAGASATNPGSSSSGSAASPTKTGGAEKVTFKMSALLVMLSGVVAFSF